MAEEKSFVVIVEEMVEAGHDLEEVVGNLQALGLSKQDAEKLVGIMEKKSLPNAQQAIEDLLRKKIISVEAARQIKLERRAVSGRRREQDKWKKAFRMGDGLVREFAPGKHLAFKQRWRKMAAARHQEEFARKEMQALFYEMLEKGVPHRVRHNLEKVMELLD